MTEKPPTFEDIMTALEAARAREREAGRAEVQARNEASAARKEISELSGKLAKMLPKEVRSVVVQDATPRRRVKATRDPGDMQSGCIHCGGAHSPSDC